MTQPTGDRIHISGVADAGLDAFEVLASSPRIGQPDADGYRKLVIGSGLHVCVALYRYDESADLVTILAIRAQKESGYHPA